ncbi:helix-turn-helix transcriptional regulator [Pediococcus stilesii]|uniref:Helix-turn-helix transcriptional regulator n=1 Tax=Pediococcus stilesii TaxID=331679 RepID=A0A5R9BSS6_9LACO|nr:helix-turn-helix transcriptional regulator [Pediococcus stilesii]TLQ03724.1 helix-turn-helix transcriptional regulator [Pediococcus stilesii]
MTFGSILRSARKEKKLSQIELIRKIHDEYGIDISTSMLSRYEDDLTPLPKRMSIEAVFALTLYLDIDLNDLARTEIQEIKTKRNR